MIRGSREVRAHGGAKNKRGESEILVRISWTVWKLSGDHREKAMLDDAHLLRLYLQNRSEESFAAVVRAHINFVHGCALRLAGGDAHLAEDITQAVFIRMARAALALVEHPALKGWLYTTTRHV